jgi:hypothetical protein
MQHTRRNQQPHSFLVIESTFLVVGLTSAVTAVYLLPNKDAINYCDHDGTVTCE